MPQNIAATQKQNRKKKFNEYLCWNKNGISLFSPSLSFRVRGKQIAQVCMSVKGVGGEGGGAKKVSDEQYKRELEL